MAREVASYWQLLLAAAALAIQISWACGWFLARTTDTDRTTAFFSSVTGGATEMAIQGERLIEHKSDYTRARARAKLCYTRVRPQKNGRGRIDFPIPVF